MQAVSDGAWIAERMSAKSGDLWRTYRNINFRRRLCRV